VSYINDEMTDAIKRKHPIHEIVQRYVSLTPRGNDFLGICPFHEEKTGKVDNKPSMSVSPSKGIFNCFSCHTGGDIFRFIELKEKITYHEAVLKLASEDGYEVGSFTPREDPFLKDYEIMDWAVRYYQNNLNGEMGTNAISYLTDRKIDRDTIEKFEIGLSISRQPLTPYLTEIKKYNIAQLVELGLTNEDGNDFYNDRIMIPIHNLDGKAIGFGGRIYQTKGSSKYVNPKETKLFVKRNVLYNYHRACKNLGNEKTLIVMEGYFDVIRASTIGVDNCVAPMGTVLTKEQIEVLKRTADQIILCFDGDAAGKTATIEAIKAFEEQEITVKVIRLEEKDPDEFIIKRGKEAFIEKIKNPLSIIDFKKKILTEKFDLNKKEEVGKYVQEILQSLVKIKDRVHIELEIKELVERFSLNYEALKQQFLEEQNEFLKKNNQKKYEVTYQKNNNLEVKKEEKIADMYGQATNNLLYYMTISPDVIERAEPKVSKIIDDKKRRLFYEIIYYYRQYGTIIIEDFIAYLSLKTDVVDTFLEIMNLELRNEYTITEIDDYIKCVNEYYKKNIIEKLRIDMKNETDPMKQANILMEIMKIRGVSTSD